MVSIMLATGIKMKLNFIYRENFGVRYKISWDNVPAYNSQHLKKLLEKHYR